MQSFKLAAAALLITPTICVAETNAKIGQNQKMWMPANFRSFDCALAPGPSSALTGGGVVSFDASDDSGVDLAVSSGNGGVPTVTAHAINIKGMAATSHRMAPQSCTTAPASSGTSSGAAACSVSGDVEAPTARFTVPLAALGDLAAAKSYVGTVTIVKRASSEAMVGKYLSKKGYDYYQAQGNVAAVRDPADPGLKVIATCDSTNVIAKGGKPMTATYDLAVGKK
jgi:hypothetical protein